MKKVQVEFSYWEYVLLLILWGLIAFSGLVNLIWTGPWTQQKTESIGYDSKEEWLMEMQVGYNGAFAELVNTTQQYIDSVAPVSGLRALPLVKECTARKISVTFALAQGEIESCFGTKGLAKRTNSVWNVGAFDSLSVNKMLRYNHPNESITDYLELLDTQYLHNKSVDDLLEKFVNGKGQRYASDQYYEHKLKDKYTEILTNTKIQKLQDQVDWYSLRL